MSSVAMLIDRMKPLVIMKDESAPRQFIWPEDMPEQCPPTDAHYSDGATFYRFVKRDSDDGPVTFADFVRPRDLPRKQPIPSEELCRYSALSIFKDVEDVAVMRNFVPGFKKKRLAAAQILREHGMILNTPQPAVDQASGTAHIMQSHFDWWVPVDIEPHTFFSVVPA